MPQQKGQKGERGRQHRASVQSRADEVPLQNDMVLLKLARPLQSVSEFPTPSPVPNTVGVFRVNLLGYNGNPPGTIFNDYPQTSHLALTNSLRNLWIDRLSLCRSETGVRKDPIVLYHKCDSYGGSSGGPIVDSNGSVIGKLIFGIMLTLKQFNAWVNTDH